MKVKDHVARRIVKGWAFTKLSDKDTAAVQRFLVTLDTIDLDHTKYAIKDTEVHLYEDKDYRVSAP